MDTTEATDYIETQVGLPLKTEMHLFFWGQITLSCTKDSLEEDTKKDYVIL